MLSGGRAHSQDNRVIITGAASGIGAAAVASFRKLGALVAGIDIAKAVNNGSELTSPQWWVEADVGDENEIRAAIDRAAQDLGGLDTVITCAGVSGYGTVSETSADEWDRIFRVNVRGVFLTVKAAIPHLKTSGGGAVVTIASQLGLVGAPATAAYCSSKGAVIQMTRAMAIDHARDGIRVNCVCPGPTLTPMLERRFARTKSDAERQRLLSHQLHGRFVEPEEVAELIICLVSSNVQSLLGAVLVIDGGYSIH